jgi:hypothetical protein
MDYPGAIALVVAITVGVVQVIASIITLVRVIRAEAAVHDVGRALNGRLDMLLQEREARVRAEHAAELERVRASAAGRLGLSSRPEGVIRPQIVQDEPGDGGV